MADGFRCQQFHHITGRHGMESFVNKECDFEINSKLYRQPMKAHQNRGNVSNSRCKAGTLELVLRNSEQRITFFTCKSKDFNYQALCLMKLL